jgi:hypothetical protein
LGGDTQRFDRVGIAGFHLGCGQNVGHGGNSFQGEDVSFSIAHPRKKIKENSFFSLTDFRKSFIMNG